MENPPINLGRVRPELYWYPFSIVCRTQRDIFGRSFHTVKFLLEVPASRDWFLDLYVVVQSERHPETANRQEASELTTLKPSSEGAGIPRPLRLLRWILRYALAGGCSLKHTRWQGGQNGLLRTPKGDGHRKITTLNYDRSTSGGGGPHWPHPLWRPITPGFISHVLQDISRKAFPPLKRQNRRNGVPLKGNWYFD